ncbi:MAG: DnaJ domain-containing protein [Chloroflexota bacterium]
MAGRRFSANEGTIYRDLQATLRKMGASSLRVGQNFETGEYEITFDRGGRRYVFRCNRWKHPLDNLRAAQRSITLLHQALEEYGTTSSERDLNKQQADPFDQFFAGFEALPDDTVLMLGSGRSSWWEVLGVSQGAAKAEIIAAFRSLARVHHPDAGGNAEDFKRVRSAYEAGLKAVGG